MAQTEGVTISWPMLAMAGAFLLSLVTGAIQLGGVQTHVIINTGRLDKVEATQASLAQADAAQVANISAIKARQDTNDIASRERLLAIEQTRPTAGELQAVAKSTNDQILRILDRLDRIEARKN